MFAAAAVVAAEDPCVAGHGAGDACCSAGHCFDLRFHDQIGRRRSGCCDYDACPASRRRLAGFFGSSGYLTRLMCVCACVFRAGKTMEIKEKVALVNVRLVSF